MRAHHCLEFTYMYIGLCIFLIKRWSLISFIKYLFGGGCIQGYDFAPPTTWKTFVYVCTICRKCVCLCMHHLQKMCLFL